MEIQQIRYNLLIALNSLDIYLQKYYITKSEKLRLISCDGTVCQHVVNFDIQRRLLADFEKLYLFKQKIG